MKLIIAINYLLISKVGDVVEILTDEVELSPFKRSKEFDGPLRDGGVRGCGKLDPLTMLSLYFSKYVYNFSGRCCWK